MRGIRTILHRCIVKAFYRENAGFFLFLFILFFGAVAPSLQLVYHYRLILGMLETRIFFLLVVLCWCFYGWKCSRFFSYLLGRSDHAFLYNLLLLPARRRYFLLLGTQMKLFLPVSLYGLAVTGVAIYRGCYLEAIVVQFCVGTIVLVSTAWCQYRLYHPGDQYRIRLSRFTWLGKGRLPYWWILIRYVLTDAKIIFTVIKITGCLFLYWLYKEQSPEDYDLRMPFLFCCFPVFGHGVLIYRLREMEERRLLFYRGLPVPMFRRQIQYCLFYFLLLIPEMVTLSLLTPDPVHLMDAIRWVTSAYSMLLLMNSILFIAPLQMSEFLKLNFVIFGILYLSMLADVLILFSVILFITALLLVGRGILNGYRGDIGEKDSG